MRWAIIGIAAMAAAIISCGIFATETQPAGKLELIYSVTVPVEMHYRIPAPGAGFGRKDGKTELFDADIYLVAHRERWVECVKAYLEDKKPLDPAMRQALGEEIAAGMDGIRDAKAQLAKLEQSFGKAALKDYLKGEGYGAAAVPQ